MLKYSERKKITPRGLVRSINNWTRIVVVEMMGKHVHDEYVVVPHKTCV